MAKTIFVSMYVVPNFFLRSQHSHSCPTVHRGRSVVISMCKTYAAMVALSVTRSLFDAIFGRGREADFIATHQ